MHHLQAYSYALGAAYCLLTVCSLVLVSRIHYRSKPVTQQKLLHVVIAVICVCRAVFFFLAPLWDGVYFFVIMKTRTDLPFYVLDQLPGLLFLSVYTALVMTWADAYYFAKDRYQAFTQCTKPALFALNAAVYGTQVAAWLLFRAYWTRSGWSVLSAGVHAGAFLVMAALVAVFGCGLYLVVRQVPFHLAVRRSKLGEVACVTGVCTVCFLIRAVALAALAVSYEQHEAYASTTEWFDGLLFVVFYCLCELLPAVAVLYSQRHRPPALMRPRQPVLMAASSLQPTALPGTSPTWPLAPDDHVGTVNSRPPSTSRHSSWGTGTTTGSTEDAPLLRAD